MKAILLGDVHGAWESANKTLGEALNAHPDADYVLQVGDMALGWPGHTKWRPVGDLPIYWIDGNHDCHDKLQSGELKDTNRLIYQPRGSTLEIENKRVFCYGGASSIDKDMRTAGLNWWPEEAINYVHMRNTLLRLDADNSHFDLIMTHERPLSFPFPIARADVFACGQGDREALDSLLDLLRPKLWIYGHYHCAAYGIHEGCKWLCLPDVKSGQYAVWDGEDIILSNSTQWRQVL